MVMANKHSIQASVVLDSREWAAIGELSKRTRVSKANFVREALRSVIIKYKALLADDPSLDLTFFEAAPAHAELIRQKRDPKATIQPSEGVVSPLAMGRGIIDEFIRSESEPPPAAVPSDTTPAAPVTEAPPRMPWSVR